MNIHSWLSEWSSWLWPNLVVHLWEAALFIGLLGLGVQLLKRAPASTPILALAPGRGQAARSLCPVGMARIGNSW